MNQPLRVEYDATSDLVVIDGLRYSGEVFRSLALVAPGTWFRVEGRCNNTVHLFSPSEALEKAFDAMTGKGAISANPR